MSWAYFSADLLWRNAWAVIPLAVIVAFACRCVRFRPATRYMLWLIVLLGFVVPLALPELPALPALERLTEPAIAELTPPESRIRPSYDSWGPRVWGDSATSPQADARIEPRVPHKLPPAPGSTGSLCERESPGSVEVEAVPAAPLSAAEDALFERALAGRQPALDGRSPGLASRSIGTTSTDIPGSEGIDSGVGLDEESMVIKPGSGWWRPWLVGLLAVRDAIGRLPAFPPSVWAAGFVLLLLYQLARVIRFQRRLRAAFPAPAAVVRTVAEAAGSFGLPRAPETLMLAECVSPMVWCGRRSRLILPARLWAELDGRGRQAIVYHELAHLRRRDHWVCWLEMLIAAVYWWHPVVWWARRRLREEADLCCDAWVTWLMPKRRRAYAEALLRTKQFVSDGRAEVPAGGISMTSMGARQLARRLTMVMTGSVRPAASLSGIALAVGLAVVGWLTLPAWACPPKTDKPACDKKEASACAAPKAAEVLICDGEGSSFETYLLRGGEVELADPQHVQALATSVASGLRLYPSRLLLASSSDEDEELDEKLERLERELERLTRQLAELRALSHIERGVLTVPTRPMRPTPPTPPTPPMPPTPPVPPTPPMPPMVQGPGFAPMPPVQYEQEIVVRSYQLPDGKLKALTALMVREDVPVLVRPLEDRIEVHATARQHKVFRAFVELIHPSKECKEKAGTPPKTSRVRPFGYSAKTSGATPFGYSAPGAAKTYEDALKTHSETLTRLYDAFGRAQASDEAQGAYKDAAKALRDAFRTQGRAAEDTYGTALDALSKYTRREARARTAQAVAMKAEAAAFARQAEELGAQAQALVERATGLARAAEDVTDAARAKALSEEVRALEKQARELERQARQLERRSRAIERESRQAQDAAGELDDSADELEETLRLQKQAECKPDK